MKATNYIIIREENLGEFSSEILAQIKKRYKAKLCLLVKNNKNKYVTIEFNKNLVVFPCAQISEMAACRASQGSSAIYMSSNKNYLSHIPTVNRSTRAMVGLGVGPYALLVSVKNDTKFEIRNLTQRDNKVYDNGILFTKNGWKKGNAKACLFGDLHEFTHDKKSLAWATNYAQKVGVKNIYVGDVFDGISLNPHEVNSSMYITNKIAYGVSLEKELASLAKTLNKISSKFKTLNIVESNHDDFLDRFLKDDEKFRKAAEIDKIILHELKAELMRNTLSLNQSVPTIEIALKKYHKINRNINFMDDTPVQECGFEMSLHGHKGSNGARFNYRSAEKYIPKSCTGHNHAGGYSGENFSVGHLTDISKQNYARGGASSWTVSIVIIYPNGTAQLISKF